jgi:thiol-disulfide isomerase/thioredoxin
VRTIAPLLIVLGGASIYGVWYRRSRGKVIPSKLNAAMSSKPAILAAEIGLELGSRVTMVQFSSAFCSPCRATRALLTDIVADMADVVHIDIDAESHLELVRKLDIRSTPTTLILNRAGVEVGRAVGAPKRDQVLTTLATIR